ncbi:MAG: DUF721 domain-containing protein [Armatimonadetes bacterium]|nr:DUF721 domain-containing protein [Armatimonadota bacterium]NIM23217.1 DUF721 domain-containing protein [Armatimonadota bacterium]NIM67085.1 DUF721 domain-containing protein [Armatimonadota bacterium]NIM75612.1 DUF721 domain-containing protein [Armatimonadota bacterium]NIN05274.1 DUF721 domain-containing protein [Armatimonadota bacterium]
MRSGKGSQARLGDIIEGLFKRLGLEHKVKQGQVMLAWKHIVGSANARHSWPAGIKDDVLLVDCSSAAWAQTLTMLREQIMEKIGEQLGECPLRDIHFRGVGRRRKDSADAESSTSLPGEIMLQTEQVEWVQEIVEDISDPALRKKAQAALGSLLRQRQWHQHQGNATCAVCGRLHRAKTALCSDCRRPRER